MTKSVSINDINSSILSVVAMTRNGDDVLLEENGKPVAKVIGLNNTVNERTGKNGPRNRTLGLGSGKGFWISDDFDKELPDDFCGFE